LTTLRLAIVLRRILILLRLILRLSLAALTVCGVGLVGRLGRTIVLSALRGASELLTIAVLLAVVIRLAALGRAAVLLTVSIRLAALRGAAEVLAVAVLRCLRGAVGRLLSVGRGVPLAVLVDLRVHPSRRLVTAVAVSGAEREL